MRLKDFCLSLLGGAIVGWLPGMTSGSAVTLCAPSVREVRTGNDISGSLRFIWLYSSISACGSVMSVGALFVILRARSGSMDAIAMFMEGELAYGSLAANASPVAAILLSMLVSAALSSWILSRLRGGLGRARAFLCSRGLAIGSLAFVIGLSIILTGSRGALVMSAATALGLAGTLAGVRRIQLMGCLLVPIAVMLVRQL
jgi:TctA family transporter